MRQHRFVPREGGVKVVFDVPEQLVDKVTRVLGDAGFEVHRYYHPADEHRHGGSPPGHTRLGAECPWRTFTDVEQDDIVVAFDTALAVHDIPCTVIGVDTWDAEGPDDPAGVREPRRPLPVAQSVSAAADIPADDVAVTRRASPAD